MMERTQNDDPDAKKALDSIITIAAEMLRQTYADDVSDDLDMAMKAWAIRLRDAHDAQIIVERNGTRQTIKQRPWR